jgi:hypothetical protein
MNPPQTLREDPARLAIAALSALLLLDGAMFAAMLAGVAPHPPGDRGPFIAATAALALGSLVLLTTPSHRASAPWLTLLTALAFVPGVGPQKFWTEPAARDLAPVIVIGSLCVLTLAVAAVRMLRVAPAASSAEVVARQ